MLLLGACGGRRQRFDMPGVVLWAWERPEDLRFLDSGTGVAYLAAVAEVGTNGGIRFRPRTDSLALAEGTPLVGVVRIETPARHAGIHTEALYAGLRQIARLPRLRGIQIDFDARASEREFYRSVLAELNSERYPVGVTALASWCAGDRWLDRQPIVEAVPMFFRMGRGESADMAVESPVCRSSIGLSLDERWPARRPEGIERVYLFNPRAWTRGSYQAALRRLQAWR